MNAKQPMQFSQSLLAHFRAGLENGEVPAGRVGSVEGRIESLQGLIDAFKGISPSVLDRIARVVVRENPACDALLRKFAAHVQHRDDGIGDLLAVAVSVVTDDRVRDEMSALYRATAAMALKVRSEGGFDFDGLGLNAARMLAAGNAHAAPAFAA